MNVIGVVEHTRNASLSQPGRETYYVTEGELFPGVADRWAVRTNGDPAHLETAVRAAIKAIDPLVLVTDMQPMSTSVDQARAPTRFALVLIGIFAAIAGVLSAVGCTVCSPAWCVNAPPKSACGWRSARRRAASSRW